MIITRVPQSFLPVGSPIKEGQVLRSLTPDQLRGEVSTELRTDVEALTLVHAQVRTLQTFNKADFIYKLSLQLQTCRDLERLIQPEQDHRHGGKY